MSKYKIWKTHSYISLKIKNWNCVVNHHDCFVKLRKVRYCILYTFLYIFYCIAYILYVRYSIGTVILLSQRCVVSGLTWGAHKETQEKIRQAHAKFSVVRVDSSHALNFPNCNNLWNELLKNSFDSTSWLRVILPPQ